MAINIQAHTLPANTFLRSIEGCASFVSGGGVSGSGTFPSGSDGDSVSEPTAGDREGFWDCAGGVRSVLDIDMGEGAWGDTLGWDIARWETSGWDFIGRELAGGVFDVRSDEPV